MWKQIQIPVGFEVDSGSLGVVSTAPGDEHAGFVEDVEKRGQGVSLKDSDGVVELFSDVADIEYDFDLLMDGLEKPDVCSGTPSFAANPKGESVRQCRRLSCSRYIQHPNGKTEGASSGDDVRSDSVDVLTLTIRLLCGSIIDDKLP